MIVSLDADFLSGAAYPGFHKLVRDYAKRRKDPANGMNRLYSIESTPTTTGMKAEHRLGLRASEVPAFAAALAAAVGASGVSAPQYAWTGEQQKFLAALAKDLKATQRQERSDSRPLSGRIGRGARARHQQRARQRGQDGHGLLRAGESRCPAIRSATSRRWLPI